MKNIITVTALCLFAMHGEIVASSKPNNNGDSVKSLLTEIDCTISTLDLFHRGYLDEMIKARDNNHYANAQEKQEDLQRLVDDAVARRSHDRALAQKRRQERNNNASQLQNK